MGEVSDEREILDRAGPVPWRTIRYGDRPEHVADLWPPATAGPGRALVVVVHGGFWRATYDRTHTRPMCGALASAGYAVAAIEYRRTAMPGGGWPGTLSDASTALALVPRLARAELAERGTAPADTVVVGHSAGGHLGVWHAAVPAGTRLGDSGPTLAPDPSLCGVVSLSGVVDLGAAYRLRLGANRDHGAVDALLGGGPDDVPERYAAADPMRLPAPPVPVALVHGDRDGVVPVELSRDYATHAAGAGGDVRLDEIAGADHFAVIDPLSLAWPRVEAAIAALIPA